MADLIVRLAILSLRPVESYWSARIERRARRHDEPDLGDDQARPG